MIKVPTENGEITISVGGHVRKISAKSPVALSAGDELWVSSILSPTAVEVTSTATHPELTQ